MPPSNILDRLALFPDSTRIEDDSISVSGQRLASLADQFGTPLYVYDRATLDGGAAAYQRALKALYPARSEVTYAAKAFFCKAIAEWAEQNHLWADCTGEAEIAIARAGRLPSERLVIHGVNKSRADLQSAVAQAGTIVIDNPAELRHIRDLFLGLPLPDLWLRLQPGLTVETHHAYTQTGQAGSKFGMTGGEISEAAAFCKENHLPLSGLHFHLGSNFRDPHPIAQAVSIALDHAAKIGFSGDWHLCPGGGWGVAYHEEELPQPEIEAYIRTVAEGIVAGCRERGLPLPVLHLEPGRSLIARAGLAIYRVGALKRRGDRTWLLVDGGMADNPRPALYGVRYSCLPIAGVHREGSEHVHIAGPYCESGDILIGDLLMPRIAEGELIAIPVSGAYQLSMASRYNGARRPAAVWLDGPRARLILRRESIDELLIDDLSLS